MSRRTALACAFVFALFPATMLAHVAAEPPSHPSHDKWQDPERPVSNRVQDERSAGPGAVLDQFQEEQDGGAHFWAEGYLAQTFTPGISGQLDHVDLLIDAWDSDPSYPATIRIVETAGGVPDGVVLGSVNVPGFAMGWNTVDFLPASVFLSAEARYGIVLLNDDADPDAVPTDGLGIQWDTNPYPPGEVWDWNPASGWEWTDWAGPPGSSDAAFRTWMVSGLTPPNDLCVDAICVADGVSVIGSNQNATGDVIGGCNSIDPLDVWYSYTPAFSGVVTISLCGGGATFDTTLAVLDVCDGALLACNDDACGLSSEAEVALSSDNTYLIRVAGFGRDAGDFTLSVTGGGGTCDTGCVDRPPEPVNPDPTDGAVDVQTDTDLAWNGGGTCNVPNGGFEDGVFAPWTTVTGPGMELEPWNVTTGGTGWFGGVPREGSRFAQNGFDGEGGLFYDIYQEVAIPAGATTAVLRWSERIQWDMMGWGATVPRTYVVSVQPAGGGPAVATLFSATLDPETFGDTGYAPHSLDLLAVGPGIAGSTVRVNFHQMIPETLTGPAQFDLDAIYLDCGVPGVTFVGEPVAEAPRSAKQTPVPTPDPELLRARYSALRARVSSRQRDSNELVPVSAIVRRGDTQGKYAKDNGGSSVVTRQVFAPKSQRGSGLIVNGGFETGDLSGWAVIDENGGSWGSWFINDGTFIPASGDGPLPPCGGNFSAVTDQSGSGTHTLYQEVTLPAGARTATLFWTDMIRDHSGAFVDPAQEFRVEIRDTRDVLLATVFSTDPGDPSLSDCTARSADISPFIGMTVRVAFTEQDSFFFFNVYLDDVRIDTDGGGCPTTYDVYLGTDAGAPDLICADADVPTCDPGPLNVCTTYHWQVIAKNPAGETPGVVWSFATTTDCHPHIRVEPTSLSLTCTSAQSREHATAAIRLKNAVVTPRPLRGDEMAVMAPAGRSHLILHFSEMPDEDGIGALAQQGVEILGYIPDHAVAASVPGGFVPDESSGIDWMGAFKPAYKTASTVSALAVAGHGSAQAVVVEFFADVEREDALSVLADSGVEVLVNDFLPNYVLAAWADSDALQRLANKDAVAWIMPASPAIINNQTTYWCPGPMTPWGPMPNYVIINDGWDGPGRGRACDLTNYFINGTPDIPGDAEKAAVEAGINEWSKHAAVLWTETDSSGLNRSMDILWASGDHGDGDPFDGVGGIIAHAAVPPPDAPEPAAGDMHFDEAESWSLTSDIHMFTVAMHEAGHSLGLGHSEDPNAVMYAAYTGPISGLQPDDIEAIQSIYASFPLCDALSDCFVIHNDGGGALDVSSVEAPPWVTLTPPPSHDIPGGGSQQVCVQVDCGQCSPPASDGTIVLHHNAPGPVVNVSVHLDCPCPNGVCDPGEDPCTCAQDCPGCCDDTDCNFPCEQCSNGSCVPRNTCPDGSCNCGETCADCPDDCGAPIADPVASTRPSPDTRLSASAKNRVTILFQNVIACAVPVAGEIVIQELIGDPPGTFGPDLSGSFTFGVNGKALTIEGSDPTALTNKTWYRIANLGAWAGGDAFDFDFLLQIGDANNDGFVNFTDLSVINASIPTFPAGINDANVRLDINGDRFINFTDLRAADGYIPSFPVAKPNGH